MRTDQRRLRRPGVVAATAAVAVAGVVGGVGVAGARESKTIYSVESGLCFSESRTECPSGPFVITLSTGDSVTWDMTSGVHNASSTSATASEAATKAWMERESPFPTARHDVPYTFGEPGEYRFQCIAHTGMEGTIIVKGEPTTTPTPTTTPVATETRQEPVPTFQATVPPGATPVPDDHTDTPAPGKAAKDTVAPRLLRAKVKKAAQGAKLSFWLSEPATIEIVARRGKRRVTSARLHAPAGTRSALIRSASLRKKGTYKLQWRATDAMGNKSNVVTKTLKVT
jgi:plastocyanin